VFALSYKTAKPPAFLPRNCRRTAIGGQLRS